jgi:hypothetical protein
MRKQTITFLLFVAMAVGLKAQQNSYTGVKKVVLTNVSEIMENNELKGYYAFFYVDKANKKENLYNLSILDNNLKETHLIEITRPKGFDALLQSAYNGERFCFSFLSTKEKAIEYLLLDKEGKTAGSYKVTGLSKQEMMIILQGMGEDDNGFAGGLVAVQGKGFVRYGMDKEDGMRMDMEFFDNNGKKKWAATSNTKNKKSFESAYPLYTNGDVAATLLMTRPKLLTMEGTEVFITFVNPDNGKELFRLGSGAKYQHWPLGVSFDETTKQYFVYGEYFGKSDKIVKDRSQGFYFQTVDLSGKVVKESFASWTRDIAKAVKVTSNGKMEDNMSVTIHKMVRTADGKIFAVGEQYKKAVSALGVASQVLSQGNGGASMVKIDLYNMVVIEFDEALKVKNVQVVEKDKTPVELPAGFEMLSTGMIGFMMKTWGWFDYSYTTVSKDSKTFTAGYINFDRSKGEDGNNYLVGNIAYTKEGKVATDTYKLTDKPTGFRVFPAKPGYIAIFEYYKKKKTADFRLEKMDL